MADKHKTRRGVTLLELLLAVTISSLLVVALGAMASAVYESTEYSAGYGGAAHHARVVSDRISRKIGSAWASEDFPGVLVVAGSEVNWTFPDTLVVWHSAADPVEPDGKPRINELMVYCPDPATPEHLLEITSPNNSAVAPDWDDLAAWQTALEAIKTDPASQRVVLTELLRVATVPEAGVTSPNYRRGCVRFEVRLRPSVDEWQQYQAGDLEWGELSWPQGIYGSQTGMRQVWVRFELQLDPSRQEGVSADMLPVVQFGSGTLHYELER